MAQSPSAEEHKFERPPRPQVTPPPHRYIYWAHGAPGAMMRWRASTPFVAQDMKWQKARSSLE